MSINAIILSILVIEMLFNRVPVLQKIFFIFKIHESIIVSINKY